MNQQTSHATITRTTVGDSQRLAFLPGLLGRLAMSFEAQTFAIASELCPDYSGGYWEFHSLSNGGFYMTPSGHQAMRIVVEGNGYSGSMSADAAGIVINLMSLNRLLWRHPSEELDTLFYALREYAAEHLESGHIFAAID